MKPILEIKNISKKFRIAHEQKPYLSIRDSFSSIFKEKPNPASEDFWALQDVSFDVYPGDSIGIIGKNGAGKSTLLKILSKITPPTGGKIIARGRIASLLEVGTGFHSELSGRENIFLNGSILGMKRKEILLKFDEIVDFSGVEKFLDTPLKHYSSGMQLRLAFAVAAFLEPEILVIDEVLAVGDAEFQKKCLGKMQNITSQGRTIIFVSHNLNALQSLCKNGVVLSNGKKISTGNISEQIDIYLNSFFGENNLSAEKIPLTDKLTIDKISFSPNPVVQNESGSFHLELSTKENNILIYDLAILIYDKFDYRVSIIDLRKDNATYTIHNSTLKLMGTIESIPLVEGDYKIGLFINSNIINTNFLNICTLKVLRRNFSNKIVYSSDVRGIVELNVKMNSAD